MRYFTILFLVLAATPAFAKGGSCHIENGKLDISGSGIGNAVSFGDLKIRIMDTQWLGGDHAQATIDIKAPGFLKKGIVFTGDGSDAQKARKTFTICDKDVLITMVGKEGENPRQRYMPFVFYVKKVSDW